MSNDTKPCEGPADCGWHNAGPCEPCKARADLAEQRRDEERARWQDASGLECGGDPDGVTPDGLAKYLRALEARVERAETENAALLSEFMDWSMRVARSIRNPEALEQVVGDLQRRVLIMRGHVKGTRHPGGGES